MDTKGIKSNIEHLCNIDFYYAVLIFRDMSRTPTTSKMEFFVTRSPVLDVVAVLDMPNLWLLTYLIWFLFSLVFWHNLFRNKVHKLRNSRLIDVYQN